MNILPAETLDPIELAQLRADADGLVQDSRTGISATYRRVSGRAFSPATGLAAYTETGTACTVWVGPLTAREVLAAGQGAKLGDVRILVAAEDVAAPQIDDRIEVGAVTYSVYRVETAPITTNHSLLCRRGT